MKPNSQIELVLLVLVSLVVVGCAPATTPVPTVTPVPAARAPTPAAPSPTPSPEVEKPRYGGILRIAMRGDAPNMDAHQERSTYTQSGFQAVYSLLVENDPLNEPKIIPDLAERWEITPDGKTFTFYLQKGAKFHDGVPVTSADVKQSFERIIWPPKGIFSPRMAYYTNVERVETPDPYTMRFILKAPQGSFLFLAGVSFNTIQPKHIIDKNGDMKTIALGSGPFILEEFNRGVGVTLKRNPDYFKKGLPYLDGLQHYVIKDTAARLAAIRTHRIDIMGWETELRPEMVEPVRRELPQMVIQTSPSNSWFGLYPNNRVKPWSDPRVRRAAFLAIDRQQGVQVVWGGWASPGSYLTPGGGWEIPQDELLKMPGFRQPKDQDRAEAKRLLAEAGYPEGFKTPLLTRAEQQYLGNSVFLKDQLRTIGIEASVDIKEYALVYTMQQRGNYEVFSGGYALYGLDPDMVLSELFVGSGGTYNIGYSNKEFEEMFAKQASTMDLTEREKLVRAIDKKLMNEAPAILVYWTSKTTIQWPEVKGYVQGPSSGHVNHRWEKAWVAR